jgi:hypothetical protein
LTPIKRKLIAIGDLHGDFHRLVRLLSEQNILDPDRLEWKPEADNVDVILLGDYIDWRGEPLEGPYSEWHLGSKRILDLIFKLSKELEELQKKKKNRSNFYPLLGNHDEMMLQGHAIMKKLSKEENQNLANFPDAESWVETFSRLPLSAEEEQDFLRFLNWYEQGGDRTIQSFGGLDAWLSAMEGELGDFLRKLPIAVVVNGKLFSHSVADERQYWVPAETLNHADEKTREQFLWGRKVWGYDAWLGVPTNPLTEGDVDEMLERLGVKSVVVGHTSLRKDQPYFHFGGKIINIDTHGIPGSKAFVEEYYVENEKPNTGRRISRIGAQKAKKKT